MKEVREKRVVQVVQHEGIQERMMEGQTLVQATVKGHRVARSVRLRPQVVHPSPQQGIPPWMTAR